MANIRERIIGAVSVMDDNRAMRLWHDIQNLYSHNYDVVHATPEEIEALDAYERGDEEYQPSISLDDLARELLE